MGPSKIFAIVFVSCHFEIFCICVTISTFFFVMFSIQTTEGTVPAPIKGAPTIQNLLFWPSDCHIENA